MLVGGLGGAFIGPIDFPIGDGPTSVAVADFDADTDLDIVVANELVDNLAILLASSTDGHPRPKGATPLLASLVPAYRQVHGAEPAAWAARPGRRV